MRTRSSHWRVLRWFVAVGALGWMACAADGVPDRSLSAIRFETGIGRLAFELRPAKESVEVFGREGRLLLRIEIEAERLLIADSSTGSVVAIRPLPAGTHRGYRVTDELDGSLRSELRIEKDGDFRLLRSEATVFYELKRRVYGFKLIDANGEVISRVRQSDDGRMSIRDAAGLTYLKTRDPIPVEAAALLAIPGLSFAEATGLAVASWIWPQGQP